MDIYYLALAISCFSIVFVYHRKMYFWLCVFLYIPAFLYLMFLNGLRWTSFKVSRFYLKNGRITLWMLRDFKLRRLSELLTKDILKDFRTLIGVKDMAVTIQKPGDRIPYVVKADRGQDASEQSTFYFIKLDADKKAAERDKIIGLNRKGQVSSIQSNTVNLGLTLAALDGWDNVSDGNGGTVPFDKNRKKDMFNLLDYIVQDELTEFVTRITGANVLVEDEEE